MTPAESQQIVSEILKGGLVYCVLAAALSGIAAFCGSYLAEKAKNVATKEDIRDITKIVESVSATFERELENLRNRNQLRLASLDRRLNAHQEGFTIWREVMPNMHDEERIAPIVVRAWEWWEKNCLFLDETSRNAFVEGLAAARSHPSLVKLNNFEEVRKNIAIVRAARVALVEGAGLPSLKSDAGPNDMNPAAN